MTRTIALSQLVTRYPYDKNVKKLHGDELVHITKFIEKHDHLGHLEFEYAVNRMFLTTCYGIMPKNQAIIQELLTCANTRLHFKKKGNDKMSDFKMPDSYYDPPEWRCFECQEDEDGCFCDRCVDCTELLDECECDLENKMKGND